MSLIVSGTGFRRKQLEVQTLADEAIVIQVELKLEGLPVGKIRVQGLEVKIAEEAIFIIEGSGEQMTQEQYMDYTRACVCQVSQAREVEDLRKIWVDTNRRRNFLQELQQASVYVDVLAEVLGQAETDQFDLLCHLTFNAPLHTRSERATAFLNRESRFLGGYNQAARDVILGLLDKYRSAGIDEICDPRIFRLSPFLEMGQAPGVVRRFGSMPKLQQSLAEMQQRIYA